MPFTADEPEDPFSGTFVDAATGLIGSWNRQDISCLYDDGSTLARYLTEVADESQHPAAGGRATRPRPRASETNRTAGAWAGGDVPRSAEGYVPGLWVVFLAPVKRAVNGSRGTCGAPRTARRDRVSA
ncbi:hypothetical protein FHS32_007032 [Streptomyces albaduncus]|uniref:Uncharacterized protein n=2 Tax=Streptomyces griseoloalbus TaxID=67303 RepID=A0A7W8FDA8_9ACTN|nr:hypothetical protein [Streptomyces albaduncus]GGW81381.1 hypothetical protein GCM10010340_69350 [Streptomyces albaduncus]